MVVIVALGNCSEVAFGTGVAFVTITVVVAFTGVVVGDTVIVTLVVTLVVGMVVEFVASWLLAGTGIKNSVMIMRRMSCA